jgi:hypothetical protein
MGRLSGDTATIGGTRGDARPGETITIRPRSADGKETGDVLTFTRTDRAYVYDLCDCYNAHRKRADVEWYVTDAQELKLGRPAGYVADSMRADKQRAEAERQAWLRNYRDRMAKEQAA